MAVKIVQNVNKLSPSASTSVQSSPIALKSGYIRVSTANTGAYVAIGTDPTATVNSFHVPPYSVEVIKERIAKQRISGIATGTTTVITFKEETNPFLVGDYVTIEGGSPVGINSIHSPVIAATDGTVTLQFNSVSVTGVVLTTSSTLSRSVRVAALGQSAGTEVGICEVVQLVSE